MPTWFLAPIAGLKLPTQIARKQGEEENNDFLERDMTQMRVNGQEASPMQRVKRRETGVGREGEEIRKKWRTESAGGRREIREGNKEMRERRRNEKKKGERRRGMGTGGETAESGPQKRGAIREKIKKGEWRLERGKGKGRTKKR
jgi:hypothetical protein